VSRISSPPYVMAIDGGTESVRVAVIDLEGRVVATAAQTYNTTFPRSGWAEQDPDEWWRALVVATRACLARAEVRPDDIAGIGLDATTCTLVALRADGRHLRPALLWMDVRAAQQANRVFATGDPALRYTLAGCNAEWMPSKTLWLAENEPEIFNQTAHLIEYVDWMAYRLTGRLTVSLNTITQRWYYNSRDGGWPTSLFAALGLPDVQRKIPAEILAPGEEAGHLSAEAAAVLGLPESVRVFQGGGDAFIGLLGLDVAGPGKLGLITGSSNVIGGFVTDEFHGAGLFGAFPDAVVPGLWLVEAGQASTGSILALFKRNFAADLPPATAYTQLGREAAEIAPGAGGVVVLDYFQGNRTPHTDSEARGAVWGLSLHTSRAQIFRALMEGIAFGTNHILQILTGYGHSAHGITACGGATRSAVFMQIYADVCGVPLSVTEVADAPLLGDAILAATGLGIYPSMPVAAQAMVKVAKTFVPDAHNHEAYQYYFEQYKATYGQLRDLMHAMTRHEGSKHGN